jgi:hypothetical protein
MLRSTRLQALCLSGALMLVLQLDRSLYAAEPPAKAVNAAIESARRVLLKAQEADGSWKQRAGDDEYTIGATSLALMALLSTGTKAADPEAANGLNWLRRQEPVLTKEISLMIQALAAANDGNHDIPKVTALARELEETQVAEGPNAGSWTYSRKVRPVGGADRCNCQFAVMGLHAAWKMGVPVNVEVVRRARDHWLSSQNGDGSWTYHGDGQARGGTGSMTVAGIATLVVTREMIRADQKQPKGDGPDEPAVEKALDDASRWLGDRFLVTHNPGDGRWLLYYLDGLGRAGRLSGRQFFIGRRGQKHDWFDEGAAFLINTQNPFKGTWQEGQTDACIGTSFGILFLANRPADE